MSDATPHNSDPYNALASDIKQWALELGFQQTAITDVDLDTAGERLSSWLEQNYQGSMGWMGEHGEKRFKPGQLIPGTIRVITVRMDYLRDNNLVAVLKDDNKAYISRYALGRDYHKLIRKRLGTLARKIQGKIPKSATRPFVDSAPVMEKPLAEKSGLGWIGKNTLLLNEDAGSWFFLGEIYINLPLPIDAPDQPDQCGQCKACLQICPTNAFPEPYVLDARRCISYLTIEHKGSIPVEFRTAMGNRVFGCDDCQIVCPWNRFAKPTKETDFNPRHGLESADLAELFMWDEKTFLKKTEGSPIRRIGYENWLRNLAIGLGNAPTTAAVLGALKARAEHPSALVREHVDWALIQHQNPSRTRAQKLKKFSATEIPLRRS
ncbi:MAG: tRNA epoxyqueuosine(34) reductase QueG [bacterium]